MTESSQVQSAAALKTAHPVLASNEGVWDGMYRRYDATGALMAGFQSRVIMRFDDTAPLDEMYHQTNIYRFDADRIQTIESKGWFDGEKLAFGSDRDVAGWAKDDASDPHGLVCLLYMKIHQDTPQLKAGTTCYELVQLSDCGQFRMRAAQYVNNNRLVMRSLIDEQRRPESWRAQKNWASVPFATV